MKTTKKIKKETKKTALEATNKKPENDSSVIKMSDKALLQKIQSRIRWDIRVSNADISMKVNDGCVTLLGYFDKPYRHAAAINVIANTEGVTRLDDQSKVMVDYFRTDKELQNLIARQVYSLPFLPGEWIDVDVCDGVAKLEGYVFHTRFKAFAARATWELSGVKDCINLIEIKESPDVMKEVLRNIPPRLERFNVQSRAI